MNQISTKARTKSEAPEPRRRSVVTKALRAVDVSRGIRPTANAERRELAEPCDVERIAELLDVVGWFIARVTPADEFRIVDRLDMMGIFAWTPTREEFTTRKAGAQEGERHRQLYAQAPGYVIVAQPRGAARWFDVWNLDGVRDIISIETSDGRSVPIDIGPANVTRIVEWMCRGARQAQRFMRAKSKFDVGDAVRVMAGPFEGSEFRVLRFEDDMRVAEARAVIVATLLGAEREITIPIRDMEKA